jgi:hypothetical protein
MLSWEHRCDAGWWLGRSEEESLGDISTLADPSVVAQLVALRGK